MNFNRMASRIANSMISGFEGSFDGWDHKKDDIYTTEFKFTGFVNGVPFSLDVPFSFEADVEKDENWSVFIRPDNDGSSSKGRKFVLNGVEIPESEESSELKTILDSDEYFNKWNALKNSLDSGFAESDSAKDIMEAEADRVSEAADPYKYRGLSRRDFI